MSENRLKIELASVRLVNPWEVRSSLRKAEVGFLVTGWDRDAQREIELVELVEQVDVPDRATCDLNQCGLHAAHMLACRLAKLADELRPAQANDK